MTNDLRQHFECPTFNKHRSASQIRYQVLSVLAPFLASIFKGVKCRNVVYLGACIDLFVHFYCLKTLLWRIEFSLFSILLCARSEAVFGGIYPVTTSIYIVYVIESAAYGRYKTQVTGHRSQDL